MFQYIHILVYTWIMLHYIYSYTDNVTLYIYGHGYAILSGWLSNW